MQSGQRKHARTHTHSRVRMLDRNVIGRARVRGTQIQKSAREQSGAQRAERVEKC